MAEYQHIVGNYSLELLTDYVLGLLDEATSERIKNDMEDSEELSSIVEGISILVESGYESFEEIEAHLETSSKRVSELVDSKRKFAQIRRAFTPFLKIAAIFVLLMLPAGIWNYFQTNSFSYLLESELTTYYTPPVVVRGNLEHGLWEQAVYSYKQDDFKSAADLLSKYTVTQPQDTQALLYLGISHMYLSEFDLAIPYFDKVLASQSRFKPQAKWFCALAHLKNGNKQMGILKLEEIVVSPNKFKHETAAKLLNKLKSE